MSILYRTATLSAPQQGREVYGVAVPYNETAEVADFGVPYQERFAPGAFARSIRERGSKVRLMTAHDSRRLPIGRPTTLEERPDGLHVAFSVAETRDGDDALTLLREGTVDAFSVGFKPIREHEDGDVVVRDEVALIEVSLVGIPAYDGATVAGVRSDEEIARPMTDYEDRAPVDSRKMRFPTGTPAATRDSAGATLPARDTTPPREEGHGPVFRLGDGATVRGRLHNERFADTADDGSGLGRALLSAVTGDWGADKERSQILSQDPTGGYFVSPQMSALLIDRARASSVLSQAGAITMPLSAPETRIVRVDSDPTAGWHDELSPLTNTSVTLGAITLQPKTLGAVVDLSVELLEDAANAPDTISRVLAEAVAEQLDRSLFRGVEADRPFTGILDDPDVSVTDMGTDGAAISDYTPYLDAIEDVETNNGVPDVRIEHPRTARAVAGLADSTGQPLRAPDSVANLRNLKTTQMPIDQTHGTATDASSVIVGNFPTAFVILGVRSNFRLDISREAGDSFENYGVKIRIAGRYDLAVGRPKHLARIEGIIP